MTDASNFLPAGRRLPPRTEAMIAYALAGLFGAVLVGRIFPHEALDGTITLTHPLAGDIAQHIAGQRYFMADSWGWPPLVTRLIEPPLGVNIALTDSIPLAALAGRLFARWLPHGGHLIYAWAALCFGVQPAAGVLALRAAGVRGVVVTVAGGVVAGCMPALIYRFGHSALCAHFTLLLALALYFRMVAVPRLWLLLPGTALMAGALLIHPYLMAMVAVILAAAPLSLLIQGRLGQAFGLACCYLAGLAVLAGVAALGGYFGADPAPGFGYYSLNLAAPFVPALSSLFGDTRVTDATGGQYEGFSYLGLGLMLLALVAAAGLRRRLARRWLAGHAGLLAVTLAACVYAVSDTVYAGQHLLFHLPIFPAFLQQFRASGRFVWIGLYVLAIMSAALTAMTLGGRWPAAILLAAALLQYADTRGLRARASAQLRDAGVWAVDPAVYRPLLLHHARLTLWPAAACNPELVIDPAFSQILLLASEIALPVNTIPAARTAGPASCDPAIVTRPDLAPGELRLLLPGSSPNLVATVPGLAGLCHDLPGGVVACTTGRSLDGQPVVAPAPFLLAQSMSLGEPAGALLAGVGWTAASPDGAWTYGRQATLLGPGPPVPGALRLTMMAHGLAPGGGAQSVRLRVNGRDAATWQVAPGADRIYGADLPATDPGSILTLELDIAQPVAPNAVMGNGDLRPLGFFLRSFRLDLQ